MTGMDRITIRSAAPDDARAIADIHVMSWQSTYAGLLPDDVLLKLDSRIHEARWWRHALRRRSSNHVVLVVEHEGQGVVGFGSCGRSRDRGLPFDGEVYTIYLLDEFHGVGVGRRLFAELSQEVSEHQGDSMIVWALKTNPARFFYEALGGRIVARRSGWLGGAPIEEVCYGWDDLSELAALGRATGPG